MPIPNSKVNNDVNGTPQMYTYQIVIHRLDLFHVLSYTLPTVPLAVDIITGWTVLEALIWTSLQTV